LNPPNATTAGIKRNIIVQSAVRIIDSFINIPDKRE
jgi:hypothetical protein